MRISREMIDEIVAHAREEVPNECCGLIGGRDGRALTLYRARNELQSPLRYNVHPQDLLRITTEIEERGEELAAIYHSHTGSPPYPSQTDVNLAENWPDPLYVICSLEDPDSPEVRAFSIRQGEISEAEIDVA